MGRVVLYRTTGRKYGKSVWKADFEAAIHVETQAVLQAQARGRAQIASGVLTHRTRELGAARRKGRVPFQGPPSFIDVGKGQVSDWYIRLNAGSKRRALYIENALGPLRAAAGSPTGWAHTGRHPGDAFGNRRHRRDWYRSRRLRQRAARRRVRRLYRNRRQRD